MDTPTTTGAPALPPAAEVTLVAPEVKPGYKTTEFWLTAFATLIGLAMAADVIPSEGNIAKIVGLVAAVLGSMGYTVVRAKAKAQ